MRTRQLLSLKLWSLISKPVNKFVAYCSAVRQPYVRDFIFSVNSHTLSLQFRYVNFSGVIGDQYSSINADIVSLSNDTESSDCRGSKLIGSTKYLWIQKICDKNKLCKFLLHNSYLCDFRCAGEVQLTTEIPINMSEGHLTGIQSECHGQIANVWIATDLCVWGLGVGVLGLGRAF